jgi:PAS domain S-box-containing protein
MQMPASMDRQNVADSYAGQYGMQDSHVSGYQNVPSDQWWAQRVLDEMKDVLLLLNTEGRITYASPSSKQITGRVAKQLEGSVLAQHLHDDDRPIFQQDLDDAVANNAPFRTHLRFQKSNGSYNLLEAYGHPHLANEDEQPRGTGNVSSRCSGFFLVCRPYPTKVSQLLDSFLEHKIENARLVQQIAKLKKEEEEEEATAARIAYQKPSENRAPLVGAQNASAAAAQTGVSSDHESTETLVNNSDESDTNAMDYFSSDTYHQLEGLSHIDGIEVMTGLHYGEGERSHGLSTGVRRGRLIHCDIDITTAADQARTAQEGDRRKRLKGQHVCSDCGTADSPEWRKGPNGPKTLCNACGCK